jgi:hypothetical protein
MYSEEEFAKLIQSNTLSKAIEAIDRMNETLRKGSVISLNTPDATLKAIESIQKSIDSFKCETMFPNLMSLSKSLDRLKSSYSSVSSSPNQEETVPNEARDAANEIVDRLESDSVFNNCTFNINVPEKSNNWTRSEILSLIQLILAIITIVAGCIHSPSEESNVADNFMQEVNQLIVDANKLANLSVDSVDFMHLEETA